MTAGQYFRIEKTQNVRFSFVPVQETCGEFPVELAAGLSHLRALVSGARLLHPVGV